MSAANIVNNENVNNNNSEDSGKTWTKWNQLINPGNSHMTISGDGTKMASIPLNGYMNTYTIR
jgi:hypothetical protein